MTPALKPPRVEASEAEWASFVEACLDLGHWLWWHCTDSRKSKAGLPDYIAVKGDQMLAFELKTERGKARPDQLAWILALSNVPGVRSGVLRPSAWREVMAVTGVAALCEVEA